MSALRVENGPLAGKVFVIGAERIAIGRDERATIRIEDHGVSREHAEVFRLGELCFVKDLGSRNGTFVRGQAAGEDLLQDGDRIQVGSTFLVYEHRAEAPDAFVRELRAVVAGLERLTGGGLEVEDALLRLLAEGRDPALIDALKEAHRHGREAR